MESSTAERFATWCALKYAEGVTDFALSEVAAALGMTEQHAVDLLSQSTTHSLIRAHLQAFKESPEKFSAWLRYAIMDLTRRMYAGEELKREQRMLFAKFQPVVFPRPGVDRPDQPMLRNDVPYELHQHVHVETSVADLIAKGELDDDTIERARRALPGPTSPAEGTESGAV